MATRNTLAFVCPMISGPGAFMGIYGHFVNLESVGKFHFAKYICRVVFRENLAKV